MHPLDAKPVGGPFVLVDPGRSIHGTAGLMMGVLHSMGRATVILSGPLRHPERLPASVEVRLADTTSVDDMARACGDLGSVSGVWCQSNSSLVPSAKLAQRLGLPGPDPLSVERAVDKGEQRRLLAQHGIAQPRHAIAYSVREARLAYQTLVGLGTGVVVKPLAGTGKVGVRLVGGEDELLRHVSRLYRTSFESHNETPPGVLVEEYAYPHGREFGVHVLDGESICIVERLSRPPFFVDDCLICPASVSDILEAKLRTIAIESVRALGLVWGPAYVEVKSDGDSCSLIEVNPRLAGALLPTIVERALGVDLIRATVARAMGYPVDIVPHFRGYSAVGFKLLSRGGLVGSVRRDCGPNGAHSIVEAVVYPRVGDMLSQNHDFSDRVGHVIVVTAEADSAIPLVRQTLAQLDIEFV